MLFNELALLILEPLLEINSNSSISAFDVNAAEAGDVNECEGLASVAGDHGSHVAVGLGPGETVLSLGDTVFHGSFDAETKENLYNIKKVDCHDKIKVFAL